MGEGKSGEQEKKEKKEEEMEMEEKRGYPKFFDRLQ